VLASKIIIIIIIIITIIIIIIIIIFIIIIIIIIIIVIGIPKACSNSVLSPVTFLFMLMISEMLYQNEVIKLFADDTNLFVFGESFSVVNRKANECLNELCRWIIANKLSLNITKACYIVFKARCDDHDTVELHCGQRTLQKVDNCHYLGVIIDNGLKWTLHIQQLYCNLIKFISIFYKLRSKLPELILKQLYFAFVHSRFMFGIELYANPCSTYLEI